MPTENEIDGFVDALDHIAKVASNSHTDTKRLRWIAHRATCAIEGGDWSELQMPKVTDKQKQAARIEKQAAHIRQLKIRIEELEQTYA